MAPGVWDVVPHAFVGTEERATHWMVTVPVLRAGEERDVNSTVRMVPMVWIVKNAVTAIMLMDVTTLLVTAAVWLDGRVSTATACVQRATGVQTAPSPVTVRMEHPALQMKEPVSVLQDTEAQPVRESARQVILVTTAVRPVHNVSIVMDHVTTSQDSVNVCQASREHCVMRCVPAVVLGRSVPRAAAAQTMEPVILLMAPVSVIQDGLAVTALNLVQLVTGDPTASTHVTATMEHTAALMMENASAAQDGLASTAHSAVRWVSLGRTALRLVNVGMELTVTTFLDSAHVELVSWGNTVIKSVLLVYMVMVAIRSVTV